MLFPAFAGWEQQADGAWKYKDDNTGAYVASQWIESTTEKGIWYYVGQTGIMVTDTLIDNQYYVDHQGKWWEGNIHKELENLDNWGSGGNLNEVFTQEELDQLAEAINNAR